MTKRRKAGGLPGTSTGRLKLQLQGETRRQAEALLGKDAELSTGEILDGGKLVSLLSELEQEARPKENRRKSFNWWTTTVGFVLVFLVLFFLALPAPLVHFTLSAQVDGLRLQVPHTSSILGRRGETAAVTDLTVRQWSRLDFGGPIGSKEGAQERVQAKQDRPIQIQWLGIPGVEAGCWNEISLRSDEPILEISRTMGCTEHAELMASLPLSYEQPHLKAEGPQLRTRMTPVAQTFMIAEAQEVSSLRLVVGRRSAQGLGVLVPTLRGGTLTIHELQDKEHGLLVGDDLEMQLEQAKITSLAYRGGSLVLNVTGRARSLSKGKEGLKVTWWTKWKERATGLLRPTLMPSRLEILVASQPAKLIWPGLLVLWPLVSGLSGWFLKGTKE